MANNRADVHAAPHRGEAVLMLAGQPHRLVFDYDAIDRVIGAFGKEWEQASRDALVAMTPGPLCTLAAIGLRKFHPELTEAQLREASPPLLHLAQAIAEGLRLATMGPRAEAADPAGETEGQRVSGLLTRLRTLLRWHNGLGSAPPNSGG